MRISTFLICGSVLCGFVNTTTAKAGFLEDVGRAVVGPVVAPVQVPLNIIQGKDPIGPYRETIQSTGRVIREGSNAVQQTHDAVTRIPRDAIERNMGSGWRQAFDTLTVSQRVQVEMATTSGRFLGGCLSGQPCDVSAMVAMPVAASLRDAYKMYASHAQPLHPLTKQVFARVVPWETLEAARYVIGKLPDISVPGFLNSGYEILGRGHAVTIGNIMIFSRMPNLQDYNDVVWLLHEMRHIEQYMSFSQNVLESIDGFAIEYVRNYQRLEDDAENVARQRAAAGG